MSAKRSVAQVGQVSWKASKQDYATLERVADRAVMLADAVGVDYNRQDAFMDLTACHCNGCPLRLQDMILADDFNFGHDVFGIRRHIDRRTGKLLDCFWPRFAQPVRTRAAA